MICRDLKRIRRGLRVVSTETPSTFKSGCEENVKLKKKIEKINEYLESDLFSSNIQILIPIEESCGL